MDLQTLLSIVFGSSVVTFGLGWLKEFYFDKKEEKRNRFRIQEEAYREIMKCADFIYADSQSDAGAILQKKNRFIENYRLLFLYAPDEVVRGVNNFLE